jgi:hypothetical protein
MPNWVSVGDLFVDKDLCFSLDRFEVYQIFIKIELHRHFGSRT